MTDYRLKKRLSTLLPGTVFKADQDGLTLSAEVKGGKVTIPVSMVDDDKDMFEPAPDHWRPLDGQKYYYVTDFGTVLDADFTPDENGVHEIRWKIRNCFESAPAALVVAEKILKLLAKNA